MDGLRRAVAHIIAIKCSAEALNERWGEMILLDKFTPDPRVPNPHQ